MSEVGEIDDAEIRARGLDALYKALGPARAHKFLGGCFTVSPPTMSRSPKGFTKGKASKRSSIGRRKNAHRINMEFRRPAKPYSGTF
jgi:hypothetical protein